MTKTKILIAGIGGVGGYFGGLLARHSSCIIRSICQLESGETLLKNMKPKDSKDSIY